MSTFAAQYLAETAQIAASIDVEAIERLVDALVEVRARRGRLFCLGLGGGAAHASHAASDFRRLAGIEAYAPTDSVASMTAVANDVGWPEMFVTWLEQSYLRATDGVCVFSVGGGDPWRQVSVPLVRALAYAQGTGAPILGIVGREGGFMGPLAHAWVRVPTVNGVAVTAHTEGFQAVIWHLLVSHPKLKIAEPKWESLGGSHGHGSANL